MKFIDQLKVFLKNLNHKARSYDADFSRMSEEEKAYEKQKLHALINSHPVHVNKGSNIEFRDVSAD